MGKDDVDQTWQLPSDGADVESQIGPWPRRLLHVESMRSYAWNPGNVYRGIKEPRYNAISYTWGRWKLNHGERPDVAGLQVHGTPWSIPRVHPEHFSAEELHQVIRRTTAAWEEAAGAADEAAEEEPFELEPDPPLLMQAKLIFETPSALLNQPC